MKKKLGWITLVILLVAIIAGASVMYNKYSQEIERENLVAEESVQQTEEAAKEEKEPESTESEQKEPEQDGTEEEQETEELVMAPDFTAYDADGNAVSLSEFIGKPIVLNFWASWCGPCQMEMPDFDEAYKEYGEEVHFLMVNMTEGSRETLESAKKFIEDKGYSFPVYYDTDVDAAMTYGVNSLPSTYFIDAEGHAIARAQGAIDGDTLLYGIKMIRGQLEEN